MVTTRWHTDKFLRSLFLLLREERKFIVKSIPLPFHVATFYSRFIRTFSSLSFYPFTSHFRSIQKGPNLAFSFQRPAMSLSLANLFLHVVLLSPTVAVPTQPQRQYGSRLTVILYHNPIYRSKLDVKLLLSGVNCQLQFVNSGA